MTRTAKISALARQSPRSLAAALTDTQAALAAPETATIMDAARTIAALKLERAQLRSMVKDLASDNEALTAALESALRELYPRRAHCAPRPTPAAQPRCVSCLRPIGDHHINWCPEAPGIVLARDCNEPKGGGA